MIICLLKLNYPIETSAYFERIVFHISNLNLKTIGEPSDFLFREYYAFDSARKSNIANIGSFVYVSILAALPKKDFHK